jgi:hypothetical protein
MLEERLRLMRIEKYPRFLCRSACTRTDPARKAESALREEDSQATPGRQ